MIRPDECKHIMETETEKHHISRIKFAMQEVKNLRSLCGSGMMIALNVILNQFKIILTPVLQISASFLAVAVSGWAFGPIMAALGCGVADILKYLLFPDGPFNIVWTAVAFVPGIIYGLVLYRRPVSLWRTTAAKTLETVIFRLGLNPLCMALLYGEGSYWYYLAMRVVKNLVLLPVEIAVLYALLRLAEKTLKKKIAK